MFFDGSSLTQHLLRLTLVFGFITRDISVNNSIKKIETLKHVAVFIVQQCFWDGKECTICVNIEIIDWEYWERLWSIFNLQILLLWSYFIFIHITKRMFYFISILSLQTVQKLGYLLTCKNFLSLTSNVIPTSITFGVKSRNNSIPIPNYTFLIRW